MRAPESLLERGDALGLLASEAARARAGSGRLVLLRGATGTGRTALLEAAAEHAEAVGMRVLRARCSPDHTSVPFDTVSQLLGHGTEFGSAAHETPDPPGTPHQRTGPARPWRLLSSYAAETPLLLAVDDIHLADDASRSWLVEAVRRIDRLPVLVVVTERSQYDIDPPADGLAHALSPTLVRSRTLAPLSADSAAELVRSALGDGAPQRWVDDCVRAGAGSPLLLRALLDDLQGTALEAAPTALPDTCAALYPGAYAAAVSWWLDSAGPATTEVARALAALEDEHEGHDGNQEDARDSEHEGNVGTDGSEEGARGGEQGADGRGGRGGRGGQVRRGRWGNQADRDSRAGRDGHVEADAEVLAGMAGVDPVRVPGWLTAMTGLGLLRPDSDGRRPRYAHPLLRDAVLSGWAGARRQAAHHRAAEAMLRRGDRAEAVAGQLLRAGPVGEEWATGALLDAAALAVRDDRSDDALVFLRRALDEPMPAARRTVVLTELGSLEYATVRSTAGIPRLAEAMRLPGPPRDRVRAAVALGTALARRGETRTAVDVLRGLEDEHLTGHPDLVRTVQTASVLLSDHDPAVREEVYRWLRETAERSPRLVGTAGQALLVRYESTAGLTSAASAMRRIRALLAQPADPLAEGFLLGAAAAVAQWADQLDEAERLVRRGLAGQRPSLLHPMHLALLNVRVDIAAARGAYAELLADPAVQRAAGDGPDPANVQAHVLVTLVETGRTEEAVRLADGVDLQNPRDSWELNRFLYARGVLRAACDDPAGALDDFLECGRRQAARDVVSPVVTPWRSAAAECHLALGRPRQALALAEDELRLATVWNTPRLLGRSLRVLGTATGGRRGLELVDRAVRVLRQGADATADGTPAGAAGGAASGETPDGSGLSGSGGEPVDTELIPALIAQGRRLTAAGERARAREALREAAERAERLGAVRMRAAAEEALREGGARRAATALTGPGSLTAGERRIAELAAQSRTNAEIGELLHLARRTVETHLTSTYRKLGIRRRSELGAALANPGDERH